MKQIKFWVIEDVSVHCHIMVKNTDEPIAIGMPNGLANRIVEQHNEVCKQAQNFRDIAICALLANVDHFTKGYEDLKTPEAKLKKIIYHHEHQLPKQWVTDVKSVLELE